MGKKAAGETGELGIAGNCRYDQRTRVVCGGREVNMMYTRRRVMGTLMGAAGASLVLQDQPPMPRPRVKTPVNPPEPAEKEDQDTPEGISRRVSRQAQEKELRQTFEQLYAKVSELKEQLEGMHRAEVFSVAVFKQTQEIEKLAKHLKSCARG